MTPQRDTSHATRPNPEDVIYEWFKAPGLRGGTVVDFLADSGFVLFHKSDRNRLVRIMVEAVGRANPDWHTADHDERTCHIDLPVLCRQTVAAMFDCLCGER